MKRFECNGTATNNPRTKRSKATPKYTLEQIANDKTLLNQVMLKREAKESRKSNRKSPASALIQPAASSKPQKRTEPEPAGVTGPESDWLGLLDAILEHFSKFTCKEKIIDFSQIAESLSIQNSSGLKCRKQWKALQDSINARCGKKAHPFFQDFRLEKFPKIKQTKTLLEKKQKKYSSIMAEALSADQSDFLLQKQDTQKLLQEYGKILKGKKESSLSSLEKSVQNSISQSTFNLEPLKEACVKTEVIPTKISQVKLSQYDIISLLKGVLSYGEDSWEKIASKCGNLSRLPLEALKSEWSRLKMQSNLEIEKISKCCQITITRATWIKAYLQKIGTSPPLSPSAGDLASQPIASLNSHTNQEIMQQLSGEYSKCLQFFQSQIRTYEFIPEKAVEYLQDLPLTEAASESREGYKLRNINVESAAEILQPIPVKPTSPRKIEKNELLQSPSRRFSMGSLLESSNEIGVRSSFTAYSKGKS